MQSALLAQILSILAYLSKPDSLPQFVHYYYVDKQMQQYIVDSAPPHVVLQFLLPRPLTRHVHTRGFGEFRRTGLASQGGKTNTN